MKSGKPHKKSANCSNILFCILLSFPFDPIEVEFTTGPYFYVTHITIVSRTVGLVNILQSHYLWSGGSQFFHTIKNPQ